MNSALSVAGLLSVGMDGKGTLLVDSGALTLASMNDGDLAQVQTLMLQYKDRPMDFADATLVHAANRESIRLILTIDHDDFEILTVQCHSLVPETVEVTVEGR